MSIMTIGSKYYIGDHASVSEFQEQLMFLENVQGVNLACFTIIVVAVISFILYFWIKESKDM